MNFPQEKLPSLIKQACALRGVAVLTPHEHMLAGSFGRSESNEAYFRVVSEVHAELKLAGYTT